MTRAQYFLNLISKYCIAFLHVFKQYFEKKRFGKNLGSKISNDYVR